MIKIAVYENQTYLRPCVVVRRSYGRCIGANTDSPAAHDSAYDTTIVYTNSLSVFGSHTFHAGPGAASGASSDSS